MQVPPPNFDLIPPKDRLGVTALLIICSYKGNEFVRIGYYVRNEYTDPALQEAPPETIDWTKVSRNIMANSPCTTKFLIDWA